ncbi:MAG: hypothetical protein KGP35_04320 [Bacteroidetes bacterium]|nr:hypothetical protein [Bacteroidota bacterium]
MNKHRLLFILHLPPPTHGASMMGHYIRESKKLNNEFVIDYINLSVTTGLTQIRKFHLSKIATYLKIVYQLFRQLFSHHYDLCYMTISAGGVGFIKDFFLILILKIFRIRIVYHFHNKGFTRTRSPFFRKLYQFIFLSNYAIVLSNRLEYDIAPFINSQRIYVCPNGIPV